MNKTFASFENRVCIVTGAGSPTGIGFSAAEIMGGLGAEIALVATTDRIFVREEELRAEGIEAHGYIADLMDRDSVRELVSKILNDFGKIDVLINNAGMIQVGQEEDFSGFLDMTYESWDDSISRNLGITLNMTKEVLPHMVERKYGRIVNTSSVTGPVASNPGESSYSAAKSAIVGMSRSLAIEFGDRGITVNNVLPGWIATASQTEREAVGGLNTPLKRGGDAREVANAIVFLASEEASYITGTSLVVDGGNTIQEYKGPSEFYY